MKRMIPALLALTLAFTACHKETVQESTKPVPRKPVPVPVQFNAADFILQFENLPGSRRGPNAARDSLRDKITYFTYQALKDDMAKRTLHQNTNTPDEEFGRIYDTLMPGHYIFRFMASTKLLLFDDKYGYFRGFGYQTGSDYEFEPLGDIFVASIAYNLSVDSPAVIHQINLERVVGKLVVNIRDAQAITWQNFDIDIVISPTWQFYYWDGGVTPNIYGNLSRIPRTGVSTFEAFLFPTDDRLYEIKISMRNKKTGITEVTKTIPGIKISPNRKTILSGSILRPITWEIQVNDKWDDDIDMEF